MAERWQQWMPFHIDRFRGSPEVQAMHPAARIGYLYLLSSSWQSEDCTVSTDALDLATESGLGDELWAIYGARILRNFKLIDGRYQNVVVFQEWEKARKEFEKNHGPKLTPEELSEAKRIAGKQGAIKRWQKYGKPMAACHENMADRWQKDGLQEQEQVTGTKKLQKPSRDKREGNPMHSVFKGLVEDAWKEWGNPLDMPWDGAEGKQLGMLIGANPKLGPDGMRRLLQYRARSTGVNLAERPSKWLRSLTDYARGPLNEFKQPQETGNGTAQGNHKPNAAVDRQRISHDAIRDAARRRYGIGVDEFDGAGAGVQAQSDTTSGDAGCVPPGMGGDSPEVRFDDFQGRTLEGTP